LSDLILKEEQILSGDPVLLPFLRADEAETETALSKLIYDDAQSVIKSTIQRRIGRRDDFSMRDADDIYHEVVLQLIAQLRVIKSNPNENPIKNFRSYTAVVAHNVCHHYLRQKHPNRARLKNRIRYLLTHRNNFFLTPETYGSEERLVCGFAGWRNEREIATTIDLEAVRSDPQVPRAAGPAADDLRSARLEDLLDAVFKVIGTPVELEALVSTTAALLNVRDQPGLTCEDESTGSVVERLADRRPSALTDLERREYLRRLWLEMKELPSRQRTVLLFNPGEVHEDVIGLLLFTGAASLREIGAAFEVGPDDFASLWRQLPLDDLTIASRLGVTRQQVINLRKSARERLARRMKAFE
jgi:RNA polymerase sigma factor (sigma-70 family)